MSDKYLAIHLTRPNAMSDSSLAWTATRLVIGASPKFHVILRLQEFPGENNESGTPILAAGDCRAYRCDQSLGRLRRPLATQTESRSAAN
jgi:hypothetical protein